MELAESIIIIILLLFLFVIFTYALITASRSEQQKDDVITAIKKWTRNVESKINTILKITSKNRDDISDINNDIKQIKEDIDTIKKRQEK